MWGAGVIRDQLAIVIWLGATLVAGMTMGPALVLAQSSGSIDTKIVTPTARKAFAAIRRQLPEAPIGADADDIIDRPSPAGAAAPERVLEPDGSEESAARTAQSLDADENQTGEQAEIPLDGVVVENEPRPVLDGVIDLDRDPRTPQDIAAFRNQAVGYDPYLFQIEIDPLRDRRTPELFRIEPYTPVGLRMGGFVIFPEAEIGGIATNNVLRSSNRKGDAAIDVRSSVRAVTDWRVHALEFRAAGDASFYDNHSSEDDRSYALEARGRLDITGRTNVEALVSHQLDKDIRSAPNSPADAAERGDVEINRAAVTFNHRFNRLSFQLRAALSDYDFAPVPSIGGGVISNDDRDYIERDAAVRATWDFGRGLGAFIESGAQGRTFHTAPADGILRSSTGEQYRLGISFGQVSNIVRGEISAGWGRQRPDDGRLADLQGLLVDASLAWRASALTTFLFTARTDFVDSVDPGSTGALARQVGLEVRHAFYRHLIGTAGIRYTSTPFDGIDLTERELVAQAGIEYYIGANTVVVGQYQHVCFDSTAPDGDYTADIVRVGFRIRY